MATTDHTMCGENKKGRTHWSYWKPNSVYAYEPYGTVSTNPSAAINISQEAVTEAGTLSDHVTSTQKQKAEDRFIMRGTHWSHIFNFSNISNFLERFCCLTFCITERRTAWWIKIVTSSALLWALLKLITAVNNLSLRAAKIALSSTTF